MPRPGFLDELKRRKVVRVGVVYLAVVWAVVQVTDVFVPALGLPPVLITVVAALAILGFPVALALAWAFDVTPEGLKRATSPAAAGSNAADAAVPHGWVGARTLVLAGVLLAVGFSAGSLVGARDGTGAGGLDRMAVAVLPFEARGADDETGFADGVHDDILTQLSRIQALRVTSRTSVRGYRGTTANIRTIAGELGVGSILEGGVQRTADRIRMNVQLIDGATDEHLWAETFDRELTATNVFQIQSEIARAVADALEATLTAEDEEALEEIPTDDLVALDLYHRGIRIMSEINTDRTTRAIPVFEEAVARDPGFARAWAELTEARSFAIRDGLEGDTLPAHRAMERTRALAPGSVESALAEGNYRYYARGDYAGALRAFQEAAGLQSGDADLQFAVAAVLRRLNRWDEAMEIYEGLARLSPRDARLFYDLGWSYSALRRWDAADTAYRRYVALAPDYGSVRASLADLALLARSDTAQAQRHVDDLQRLDDSELPEVYQRQLAYLRGEPVPLDIGGFDVGPRRSFGNYTLYPDGPVDLWLARVAWVQGDTARARELGDGLEEAFLASTPALQPGANAIPPDGDLFGLRATQLLLRAWGMAFRGERQAALRTADEALALHSFETDATDGALFQRQRMLIRVVAGDLDGAVADLRQLLARPGFTTVGELRLDPIYDPLRGRADFQELLARPPAP